MSQVREVDGTLTHPIIKMLIESQKRKEKYINSNTYICKIKVVQGIYLQGQMEETETIRKMGAARL